MTSKPGRFLYRTYILEFWIFYVRWWMTIEDELSPDQIWQVWLDSKAANLGRVLASLLLFWATIISFGFMKLAQYNARKAGL